MGDVSQTLKQKTHKKISIAKSFVTNASHCLICNVKLYPEKYEGQKEVVFLLQAQTTAQHDVSKLLDNLVGKIIFDKQIHSDIICRRCFRLLDRIDFLQEELSNAKEKLISQFQQTEAVYTSEPQKHILHSTNEDTSSVTRNVGSPKHLEGVSEKVLAPLDQSTVKPLLEGASPKTANQTQLQREDQSPTILNNTSKNNPQKELHKGSSDLTGLEVEPRQRPDSGIKNHDLERRAKIRPKELRKIRSSSNLYPRRFSSSSIKCLHCDMAFAVSMGLRTHLVHVHSVEEWKVDEEVLKSWIHRKMLISKESVANPSELVCCWCEESFESFDVYYGHLYKEHLIKNFEKYCKIIENFKESVICRLCGLAFTKLMALEEHLKSVHTQEAIRECLLCDELCNGEAALFRHINHHVLGVQQCTICPCTYSTQRQFTSHLESFHENKYSIKCTQCSRSFKSYADYEVHQDTQHDKEKMADNSLKDSYFGVKTLVSVIKKEDKDNKPLSLPGSICTKCNTMFAHKSQFQRHLYSFHPSDFRYRCEECECLFKQFGDLISHQVSHIFGSHRCPHCNAKFSRVDQIKKHLSFSHPFVKGLECKLCIKIFKTYDTYLNHLKLKHPEASGSAITYIDCSVCQKKFANKYQLYLHKRIHNTGPSTCNICGLNVKHLSSHMNSHTKAVSYICKECGVSYINKSSLNVHMKRIHLGDSAKRYLCVKCSKKFISSSDLQAHTAKVHYGERKFVCRYCDKAYKNKVTLTYHMRKHTGQRPHECTLCSLAFEIPTMLRQHLKRYHNAEYKGVYFKKSSVTDLIKRKANADNLNVVHINVPSDMRKEVVSTSYEEGANDDKILVVVDC